MSPATHNRGDEFNLESYDNKSGGMPTPGSMDTNYHQHHSPAPNQQHNQPPNYPQQSRQQQQQFNPAMAGQQPSNPGQPPQGGVRPNNNQMHMGGGGGGHGHMYRPPHPHPQQGQQSDPMMFM